MNVLHVDPHHLPSVSSQLSAHKNVSEKRNEHVDVGGISQL